MHYFSTGQFARKAGTTERTIRYYDKIGLLKPTSIMQNGYRRYSDQDLIKIQKIMFFKQLGFTIEEIFPLVLNENKDSLQESLRIQIDLLSKKITHMEILKDSLKSLSKEISVKQFDWLKVAELAQLTSQNDIIVEQYKNTVNLNARISLHDQYSTNKTSWFSWLYQNINFTHATRILELGCGNGRLWEYNKINLRNREIFLSDISEGMVDAVKKKFGQDMNCLTINAEEIPFKNEYFPIIIANHILFYLNNISKGLSEIQRVLSNDGILYCSTYGETHMREINELVEEFDPHIYLSKDKLFERFGLENAEEILKPYFSKIELKIYDDSLKVDKVQPLIDYILSCHGNQNELLTKRIEEFREFLQNKMNEKGFITITKKAGLIIAQK